MATALQRRSPDIGPTRVTLGNLTIDRATYRVWVDDEEIHLSYTQFELLFYLASRSGKVVPYDALAHQLWGTSPRPEGQQERVRKLTVHVCRLRKALKRSSPWTIQTVRLRGLGLLEAHHPGRSVSV